MSSTAPRPGPPRPADFAFWTEEKLRFCDTDLLGHVNNAVFSEFAEAGRVELLTAAGGTHTDSYEAVIVRLLVNFHREIHFPNRVRIGSAIARVGTSSFDILQGMFVGEDCVGSAESTLVLIDPRSRRPTPVPPALRERLLGLAPHRR
jgi:acyl-CoA thioester hydrolase